MCVCESLSAVSCVCILLETQNDSLNKYKRYGPIPLSTGMSSATAPNATNVNKIVQSHGAFPPVK